MSSITWDLRIDWSNNGVFTGTGEDVTARSLDGGTIHLQYGRDVARAQSPVSPGQATFELNNSSKDYSPNNGSSPVAGLLLPGRGCYLKATHSAVTYTLFQGFLDGYDVDAPGQSVSFSAVDVLARLRGVNISTTLKRGIRGGEAIGFILDAIGWTGGRDLDSGGTIFPYWWERKTDAYEALQKVLQSEGPPAIAFVSSAGAFTFRDRHHRLVDAASVTSQATFKDSGADSAGSVVFSGFDFDTGWRDVINEARFSVEERFPTSGPVTVWEDESLITISPSVSEDVEVETSDPFQDAIVPVEGQDFELVFGSVTPSLSQTSGQGTTLTFLAGGSGAKIQNLKLRATSIPVVRTRVTATVDAASQVHHGIRSWPDEAPFAGVHDAKGVANVIVNLRKDKREIIKVTLDGGNADVLLVQQLDRELSDRVTITETETVTNAAYFIERIEHEISDAGGRLTTDFHCERAPTTLDSPSTVFLIGTSLIGTGILAR
jgi:hypothetical protein